MRISRLHSILIGLSACATLAAGPCSSAKQLVCPTGTVDDGTTSNCVSDRNAAASLGVLTPLGTIETTFHFVAGSLGFVMGTGDFFSRPGTSASDSQFAPETVATFAKGPLPSTNLVTEAFTSVAVYSKSQAVNAGVYVADPNTFVVSDLTGYIVASGYALSNSGAVVSLVARYTPRGTLDTSFGGTGYILGNAQGFTGGSFTMIRASAIDPWGNIVIAGFGNTHPSAGNYLSLYQIHSDDMTFLRHDATRGVDELQSFVARYTPLGALDSTFDTANAQAPPNGSAKGGFAVSPNYGFTGASAYKFDRWDVINSIAIDSSGGIFAVGGTSASYAGFVTAGGPVTPIYPKVSGFIAHYRYTGVLGSVLTGKAGWGLNVSSYAYSNLNDNQEFLSSAIIDPVSVDAGGNIKVIAAGVSGTNKNSYSPLVARYFLANADTLTEAILYDTSYNPIRQGFRVEAPVSISDTINSIAYDPSTSTLILAGASHLDSSNPQALIIQTPYSGTGISGHNTPPVTGFAAAVAGNVSDTFRSIAVLATGSSTHYFATGSAAIDGTHVRSVIANYNTTPALSSSGFFSTPYTGAPTSLRQTHALYPFALNQLPPSALKPTAAGAQIGPIAAVYGGGALETFNASALSPDGKSVIVVGYTTNSATSPLTGRSYPLLLIYGGDGTFTNIGAHVDFTDLQNTL